MGDHVPASMWCITRDDLDFFEKEVRRLWSEGEIPDSDDPHHKNPYHNDPKIGPSIHQVNKHYIIPTTRECNGASWALMRNPYGLKCDLFATHCWAEGVFEFIDAVRQGWPRDANHLYCCFLSNPQDGDVSEILGDSIKECPFYLALKTAKTLLVIPNRRVSIYSRLWCV